MADLRFREEKPSRTIPVTPTVSRQAEVELASAETIAESPKVRVAEWLGLEHAIPSNSSRIPTWAFLTASAAMWVIIAAMLTTSGRKMDTLPFGALPPILRGMWLNWLQIVGLSFLMFLWAAQAKRDRKLFRQRMHTGSEPQDGAATLWGRPQHKIESDFEMIVVFLQDGRPYGRDIGHLRFERSSLDFEGARTHFSISKSRLSLQGLKPGRAKRLLDTDMKAATTLLSYEWNGHQYSVGLIAPKANDTFHGDWYGFVRRWMMGRSEAVQYEVLLPSETPQDAPWQAIEPALYPALLMQWMLLYGIASRDYSDYFLLAVVAVMLGLAVPVVRSVSRFCHLRRRLRAQARSFPPDRL